MSRSLSALNPKPKARCSSQFKEMVVNFITNVLLDQPSDIYAYAELYFTTLHDEYVKLGVEAAEGFSLPGSRVVANIMSDMDLVPALPLKTSGDLRRCRKACINPELYDPEEDCSVDTDVNLYIKTDMERKHLMDSLTKSCIFSGLSPDEMSSVVDLFYHVKVKAGDIIMKKGEEGDLFYVVKNGKYEAVVKDQQIKTYRGVGCFGEMALLYNQPRSATIAAISDGNLWAIDRKTFRTAATAAVHNTKKLYTSFVEKVPLFAELSELEKCTVADVMVLKYYNSMDTILSQNDDATCMFFVVEGHVEIRIKQGTTSRLVKTCSTGEYFGELALLSRSPRAASAFALGKVKCAMLDVDTFERLLGKCLTLIQRNASTYEKAMRDMFGEEKPEDNDLRY